MLLASLTLQVGQVERKVSHSGYLILCIQIRPLFYHSSNARVLCVMFICVLVNQRHPIKSEAEASLVATLYARFFVSGGIMEEGDTRLRHD